METKGYVISALTAGLVIVAIATWQQAKRANLLALELGVLQTELAEIEKKRFNYVASVEGGAIILENRGDVSLTPDSVSIVPMFSDDREFSPDAPRVPLPFQAVGVNSNGNIIIPEVVNAVCSNPNYLRRCANGQPKLFTIIFRLESIETRQLLRLQS